MWGSRQMVVMVSPAAVRRTISAAVAEGHLRQRLGSPGEAGTPSHAPPAPAGWVSSVMMMSWDVLERAGLEARRLDFGRSFRRCRILAENARRCQEQNENILPRRISGPARDIPDPPSFTLRQGDSPVTLTPDGGHAPLPRGLRGPEPALVADRAG